MLWSVDSHHNTIQETFCMTFPETKLTIVLLANITHYRTITSAYCKNETVILTLGYRSFNAVLIINIMLVSYTLL